MITIFVIIFFSGRKVRIWCSDSVAIFRSAKTITLQRFDVISPTKDTSFMVDKKKRRPGKTNCAAGDPGAVNCANKTDAPGITMHYLPKDETLRQNWTRFVRIHRKDFVPTKLQRYVWKLDRKLRNDIDLHTISHLAWAPTWWKPNLHKLMTSTENQE